MNDIKQVIVMRKDLNMRKGKMIAQGAHASLKVILDLMVPLNCGSSHKSKILHVIKNSYLDEWINGLFTKVVVYVNSEKELLDIYEKADHFAILCSLIKDAGNTEFHGIPTYTCCAIGPDRGEIIDKITGGLSLL
jgi:PTH2 family peptidyl-tRNA hydrolase